MSVVDEVKARIDIVDLISEQLTLQRAGRNFRALCPFHNERTPSFYVSPDRQTWHCFGACGEGGDVFSFVMKRENVDFAEALRGLAERAGVTLRERRPPEEEERERRLIEANDGAAAFFHHALMHATAGADARAYLEQRGVDGETMEVFQLGFSPDSWDALKSHLVGRGYSQAELVRAGLLVEGDRGPYDRFRGRLMFPIRDERGRVVGFGARALAPAGGEAAGAKYINTPQTPLFDKSRLLYALDRAQEAIRRDRTVIVVEGYMDAIAAHQHGITNVVASMGTALTERQIRLLERFRARTVLALDADAAGIEATLRALQEAEAAGAIRAAAAPTHPGAIEEQDFSERVREWSRDALKRAAVNFFVLPLSGKDPDEMIRRDRAAWDDAVAAAQPFTEYVFDLVAGRRDLSQPAERSALLQELLPVVRLIDEPVFRAHYAERLARLARIDEDVVRAELRRRPGRRARTDTVVAPPTPARRERAEEFCLALLLRHTSLRASGLALPADFFVLSEHRAILDAWRETQDLEAIRAHLPDELHPQLDRILGQELPYLESSGADHAFQDCVRRIELRRLSAAKQARASALTEPDAQPYMRAAVEEAIALQDAGGVPRTPASPVAADAQTHELATTLIEDTELGRRLHQLSPTPESPARPGASPSPEED